MKKKKKEIDRNPELGNTHVIEIMVGIECYGVFALRSSWVSI